MATLEIRKETYKVWRHVPSDELPYIVSKLYIKSEGDNVRVVELGGSQRGIYNFADVSVYDIGGTAETFTSASELMQRLEALGYVGFFYDGEVSPSLLISSDVGNAITLGSDGKLYASTSGGGSSIWGGITGTLSDQTDLQTALDDKQDTLVSGTNIKTINGNSILGSGDLVVSNKKSIEYNVTSLCVFNFPATSNWTCAGGANGMGAYGAGRTDSFYSNFLSLIASSNYFKIIGGIAPFNMKLTSNSSFVTPEPNLVGGDLKLVVGYVEFNYATGVLTNATIVDAGTYTPATGGRVDLREDFGGEITIPKGAIWCYSWAHTKTSAVSGVYIQTILNFEEV